MSGAREPITPFIVKLPALAAQHGVSCVLVIGGSGQYFDVAGEWAVCRPPRINKEGARMSPPTRSRPSVAQSGGSMSRHLHSASHRTC